MRNSGPTELWEHVPTNWSLKVNNNELGHLCYTKTHFKQGTLGFEKKSGQHNSLLRSLMSHEANHFATNCLPIMNGCLPYLSASCWSDSLRISCTCLLTTPVSSAEAGVHTGTHHIYKVYSRSHTGTTGTENSWIQIYSHYLWSPKAWAIPCVGWKRPSAK